MKITETLKKEWYIVVLLVLPFMISMYFWDQLPEQVPTHFNMKGEADGWGPKWINAYLIPLIGVGNYLLILLLPIIDPKKKIQNDQKSISKIRVFISLFMVGLYGVIMVTTLGYSFNLGAYITTGVGLIIMVLGNYMNSIKPNYFVGVRTPWTLESPEVWKSTHRFTSKLWTFAGAGMIVLGFIPFFNESPIFITTYVLIIAIPPIAYSYILFKKLEKGEK